jgi:hypothetical protein
MGNMSKVILLPGIGSVYGRIAVCPSALAAGTSI